MTRWVANQTLREEYREAWEASGVTCSFLNAGEEGNDPLRLIKRLSRYVALTDAMPELLQRSVTVEDIRKAHRVGKRTLCLTLNGVPLTGASISVEDELRPIRVFAQLGARMMHLTYNRRNPIGDGCAEASDGGLTDFGHAAIREMNRLGITIDVAHSGWKTSLEAAKASVQPVMISHSAAFALSQHVRCKPDEVIRAVVDGGGAIGVANFPRFLRRSGDIIALLDHVDYISKKFGTDAVTIGTDAPYSSRHSAEAYAALRRVPGHRGWENFWPPGENLLAPEWRQPQQISSMAWTNWPLFTVGLVQRGYSDDDIRKIIGGNILRVAGHVWKTPIG